MVDRLAISGRRYAGKVIEKMRVEAVLDLVWRRRLTDEEVHRRDSRMLLTMDSSRSV